MFVNFGSANDCTGLLGFALLVAFKLVGVGILPVARLVAGTTLDEGTGGVEAGIEAF